MSRERRGTGRVLLALLVCLLGSLARAQEMDPTEALLRELAGAEADGMVSPQGPAVETQRARAAGTSGGLAGLPYSPDVLEALQSQAVAQAAQLTAEGQHRVDTFHWQLFASRILFWLVVLVVLTGLVLAVRQVLRGVTVRPGDQPGPQHEMEASMLGLSLKISSPGLGVVMLIVSMLFFYMYAKEVFPIRVV